MRKIKLFLAKLHLLWTTIGADVAKKLMNKEVDIARAAEEEIDCCYENFLKRAKEQTKAEVNYLRLVGTPSGNPLMEVDLGIEHYIVKPELADKITRYDMETALTRHRYGDWGEVSNYSWILNNSYATNKSGVIRSRYPMKNNKHFIIKTDMDARRTEMFMEAA